MTDQLLTPQEAADKLGVYVTSIYGWVRRGLLPAMYVPHLFGKRILRQDVDAFVMPHLEGHGALPGLTGYQPDTSTVFALLMRHQPQAYSERRTRSQEARQIALFLSDPEYTLEDILAAWKCRREEMHATFAHWGADARQRRLLD